MFARAGNEFPFADEPTPLFNMVFADIFQLVSLASLCLNLFFLLPELLKVGLGEVASVKSFFSSSAPSFLFLGASL